MRTSWDKCSIESVDAVHWQQWDKLNEENHHSNPLLSSTFITHLLNHYPKDALFFSLKDDSNSYVAFAIIGKEKGGVWSSYKPAQAPIELMVVKKGLLFNLNGLMSQLPNAKRLDFRSLDPQEHEEIMAELPNQLIRPIADNISISVNGSFEEYWAKRKKKLRYNVRNAKKILSNKFENIEYTICEAADDLAQKVDVYGEIESAGWKGIEGSSLNKNNTQGQFFREIMHGWASNGNARVYELKGDGEVLASILCCYNSSMITVLKMTYNEAFQTMSLGRILLHYLIEDVFDNKVSQNIEFYTNADDTFKGWATEQRHLYSGKIYSNEIMHTIIPVLKIIFKKVRNIQQKLKIWS